MARMILFILPLVFNYATGACFHVDTRDLMEYSCNGGYVTDLNGIPEGVERLKISRMRIPIITPHTFSRFSESLLVLKCSECEISEIEPNAFGSMTYLQQLSLDNNRLSSVKASWIEGLRDLNYLDLTYNQIEEIEDDAFQYLGEVTDLRLSGNRLKCLNLDAMSQMGNLKRIFLNDNPNFQCPNAVTKFLEDRNVTFQEDESWKEIIHDLIPASRNDQQDWRSTRPYPITTTPVYRERITDTRRPDIETQWTTYTSTHRPIITWTQSRPTTTTTESDIAREDMFLSRSGDHHFHETHTPSMDRNWMTTQTPRYWPTEHYPRTRPEEITSPPFVPTETIHSTNSKGVYQQPEYVPRVTISQEVDNYRQTDETSTVSNLERLETEKPLPDCENSSSIIYFKREIIFLAILLFVSKTFFIDRL
ncbi:leucine-rich repeat transmembrane protein FLRT3 isoform X1 [Leptopilina boulardi]|uniref:leucine-rich repeat transmembrane protein FLRT3 isoform X1 n=1 Tax=Leptopilina boulardi TaxID=63433 RepID=UPI0021F58F17|nr:leucine-rich repeat transmembrane protein FLRT3 isoform X1 [Leptopilina boulardi]XP_051170903.1 leucine-rich repeat transmembrane protein FLRT3 isoform X1 [Leptopilina boulardi]